MHNGGNHNGGSPSTTQRYLAKVGSIYAPYRVLWTLTADMNTTNDQAFTRVGEFASFSIVTIRIINASTSLTTAVGGIYSAASKGGDAIVAASQVYNGATSSALGFNLSPTNAGLADRTETPILSLSTPQGAAATLQFRIMGIPIS